METSLYYEISEILLFLFPCDLCDYKATVKENLHRHVKVVHEVNELIYCSDCDFKTKNKNSLQSHKKLFHSVIQKKFKCNICTFETIHKNHFISHTNNHQLSLEERAKFQCTYCDHKATEKGNLRRHIKMKHQVNEMIYCIHCDFKTKNKDSLRNHKKRYHS